MKSYQIELSDAMATIIEHQAKMLASSPEELIRATLWEHFRQYLQMIPTATIEEVMDVLNARMTNLNLKSQAASGTLACLGCTQRLTPTEVDNGFCSKCHEPIQGLA